MIEIVQKTESHYDREAGRFLVRRQAYVVVDGKWLTGEESREMLRDAYHAAGLRAPVPTPVGR